MTRREALVHLRGLEIRVKNIETQMDNLEARLALIDKSPDVDKGKQTIAYKELGRLPLWA